MVERIERRLVLDKRFVLLFSVSTKIHMALGCCYEVKGLPNLCLIGALQKELQQVQVVGLLPAVQLQQAVDAGFQKQSIIDSIQAYAWLLVPADLSVSSEKRIHDVI